MLPVLGIQVASEPAPYPSLPCSEWFTRLLHCAQVGAVYFPYKFIHSKCVDEVERG